MSLRIAFYKGTRPGLEGLYSRLARWMDRGPYSHCELIFSDGMSASASFVDGGVRYKQITYNPAHWDFMEIPDPSGNLEKLARLWFDEHEGAKYDLWGNVRFVFGGVKDSSDRFFCSEATMAGLGFAEAYRYGPCGMVWVLTARFAVYIDKPAT